MSLELITRNNNWETKGYLSCAAGQGKTILSPSCS